MKLLNNNEDSVTCEIENRELLMFLAGLREVCYGVEIPCFETRVGFTKETVGKLLQDIVNIADEAKIEQ